MTFLLGGWRLEGCHTELRMLRFVARRVFWGLVTLLIVVSLAFFAVNLFLPYDYAVGLGQRPRAIEAIREQLGLDRPLVVQWLDYMSHFARGDLGVTYEGTSVSSLVWSFLPWTVGIFAVGGIVAYLFGEWFGRLVGWSRYRLLSSTANIGGVLLFTAFPPFLVFMLFLFGAPRLSAFRSSLGLGFSPDPGGPSGLFHLLAFGLVAALVGGLIARAWARKRDYAALRVTAVPLAVAGFLVGMWLLGVWGDGIDWLLWNRGVVAAAALVLIAFGEMMLVMGAGVSEEIAEDYVFTARAKGIPGSRIRDRHVAPNAVLPAISRLVTSIPYLIGGLVIIEVSAGTGGLGSLLLGSIESGQVPVVLGVLGVIGVIGIGMRVVLDVVQAVIDPRLREETRT
jgi:peptide/nickel transport system permease protein